jgi:hypothetical protein
LSGSLSLGLLAHHTLGRHVLEPLAGLLLHPGSDRAALGCSSQESSARLCGCVSGRAYTERGPSPSRSSGGGELPLCGGGRFYQTCCRRSAHSLD